MAPPKLIYFALKGLGEPIRFILSYAGEEFIDERITFGEWPAVKPKMPFGKMPIIEINGEVVPQSRAIARYFAKKAGIAGKDDWEALLIDSVVDTIIDLSNAITGHYWKSDESSKAKEYDVLINETVPFYLERFNEQVKKNGGYFVNAKLTWADLFFVALFDYLNELVKMDLVEKYPALKAQKDKVYALPAIKAWIAKRPKESGLPK